MSDDLHTYRLLALACAAIVSSACGGRVEQAEGATIDPAPTPAPTPGPTPVLTTMAIAAGGSHTCVLVSDGTLRCWGSNAHGQIGEGAAPIQRTPFAVAGISGATAVTVGFSHTCAIVAGGEVRCWGGNGVLLGDGVAPHHDTPSPVAVAGVTGAVALTAGNTHTCALLDDGTVRCWGNDAEGELGDGGWDKQASPVQVRGLDGVVAIGSGAYHTCAALAHASLRCWGADTTAQLGDGGSTKSNLPVVVRGVTNVTSITGGFGHTCVRIDGGDVLCWGADRDGVLGNGSPITDYDGMLTWPKPAPVVDLPPALAVASAYHSCAVLMNGELYCWGLNYGGQLGDGTRETRSLARPVPGLTGVRAVAMTVKHTCALVGARDVQCWGDNEEGQLGDGTAIARDTPAPVRDLY